MSTETKASDWLGVLQQIEDVRSLIYVGNLAFAVTDAGLGRNEQTALWVLLQEIDDRLDAISADTQRLKEACHG